MTIEFTHNDRPTVGIEMELHVVDRITGDLVSAANELLAELGSTHPGGEHPKAKHELFQSTVEIITGAGLPTFTYASRRLVRYAIIRRARSASMHCERRRWNWVGANP